MNEIDLIDGKTHEEIYEAIWKDKPFLIPCKNSECEIRKNIILYKDHDTNGKWGIWGTAREPRVWYMNQLRPHIIDEFTQKTIRKQNYVTNIIVYERLNGLSYEKIAAMLAKEHKVKLSWQAIQQRVARYKNMLQE